MKKANPSTALSLVISFVLALLCYVFLAATINENRGPIEAPEWLTIARVILVALTAYCFAIAFFLERRIRTKKAEKLRKKDRDPELMILICGLGLFLAPTCFALLLFFLGSPVADFYVYAALSFIGIAAWAWRKRALFRFAGPDVHHIPSSETRTISPQGAPSPIVRAYTIVLILMGVLTLVPVITQVLVMTQTPHDSNILIPLFIFMISFNAIITAVCWTAVFLRARRSPYALAATGAVSIMLLFWFPFGTAAFIYWVGWVRKKERQKVPGSASEYPVTGAPHV